MVYIHIQVLLSSTHPVRFIIFRRYVDAAARLQHMQSSVWTSFLNFVHSELQIVTHIAYEDSVQVNEWGWDCRREEHEEDAKFSMRLRDDDEDEEVKESDRPVGYSTESTSMSMSSSSSSTSISSSSSSSSSSSGGRVAQLVTFNANAGRRSELLRHIETLAEYAKDRASIECASLASIHTDACEYACGC
jgi:hypothetical protein